jgi:diguanylate cyclase (GGDEF)-like protein/PAS domain S-box-containing protein
VSQPCSDLGVPRPLKSNGSARVLGICFLAVFSASLVILLDGSERLIWLANGLLLSYLLVVPRWLWRQYAAVGFAALLVGSMMARPGQLYTCVIHAVLNTAEAALSAWLLRRRSADLPRFTDERYLLRFGAIAVVGSPTAIAFLFAIFSSLSHGLPGPSAFYRWIATDGLGIAIVTPTCVSLSLSTLNGSKQWQWHRHWILLAALVPVTIGTFCQTRLPLIFVIYPLVGLILFRLGLGCASLSTLFVTAVGGWFTIHGLGPFPKIAPAFQVDAPILFQLYLASGMFLVFAAASVLETLRAATQRLNEIAALHKLVTENSLDVIIIADFNGNRRYVSASAIAHGGWGHDELLGQKSLELVHPEDRAKAGAVVRSIQMGGEGALIECRTRRKDGEYVWVEANLRPIRDPVTGTPTGILNIVRDISRRKRAEQSLKEAYDALAALATTDPLTGLANRRRFEQCITAEWRRAKRECEPLSLLVLDADWFKSYNDTYGHLRGDTCLKQIAEAALDVVMRSSDLVARIGGEEFAVILPNTPASAAVEIANQICAAIRRRRLPHNTNPTGYVTISAGCATIVPAAGQHSIMLMRRADEALYAAKHAGRNQARSADAPARLEEVLEAS